MAFCVMFIMILVGIFFYLDAFSCFYIVVSIQTLKAHEKIEMLIYAKEKLNMNFFAMLLTKIMI